MVSFYFPFCGIIRPRRLSVGGVVGWLLCRVGLHPDIIKLFRAAFGRIIQDHSKRLAALGANDVDSIFGFVLDGRDAQAVDVVVYLGVCVPTGVDFGHEVCSFILYGHFISHFLPRIAGAAVGVVSSGRLLWPVG
jgi:hypothetical protein